VRGEEGGGAKETYISAKETYTSAKEAYVFTKEPGISFKVMGRGRGGGEGAGGGRGRGDWVTGCNTWHHFDADREAKLVVTERLLHRRSHLT